MFPQQELKNQYNRRQNPVKAINKTTKKPNKKQKKI